MFGQDTFQRPFGVAVKDENILCDRRRCLHVLFQSRADYQLMRRTDSKGG